MNEKFAAFKFLPNRSMLCGQMLKIYLRIRRTGTDEDRCNRKVYSDLNTCCRIRPDLLLPPDPRITLCLVMRTVHFIGKQLISNLPPARFINLPFAIQRFCRNVQKREADVFAMIGAEIDAACPGFPGLKGMNVIAHG
jgi:hypothetical protein